MYVTVTDCAKKKQNKNLNQKITVVRPAVLTSRLDVCRPREIRTPESQYCHSISIFAAKYLYEFYPDCKKVYLF